MKKGIRNILIFSGFILAALPCTAFSQNLIENGGFEQLGANNLPEGWKVNISRNAEAEVEVDENEKHSGDRSLKIFVAPPGGRVIVYMDESISGPVTPGMPHEATIWVKTENIDFNRFSQSPAIRVNYQPQRTKPGGVLSLIAKTKGVSEWMELKTDVPPALTNSRRIYIDIVMTKGTLWVDDIEVRPVE
ncbi:MAG: hypothetical protein ACLFMN_03140 [Desulfobacterales bacterium]